MEFPFGIKMQASRIMTLRGGIGMWFSNSHPEAEFKEFDLQKGDALHGCWPHNSSMKNCCVIRMRDWQRCCDNSPGFLGPLKKSFSFLQVPMAGWSFAPPGATFFFFEFLSFFWGPSCDFAKISYQQPLAQPTKQCPKTSSASPGIFGLTGHQLGGPAPRLSSKKRPTVRAFGNSVKIQ